MLIMTCKQIDANYVKLSLMPLNGSKTVNPEAGKWLLAVAMKIESVTLTLRVVK